MRRPELTPARSRSRRAHHTDATHRRLIGGSRLSDGLAKTLDAGVHATCRMCESTLTGAEVRPL